LNTRRTNDGYCTSEKDSEYAVVSEDFIQVKKECEMAAYMIVDIDVHDSDQFEFYAKQVPRLIAKHGGEYLVRGGEFEVIEGSWEPSRIVIFRFPDRAAINAFFDDPEYQPLLSLRHSVSTSNILAVDGL